MPIEDFDLKEPLGKGSFGSVCKCVRKSDGEVYAMKQVSIYLARSRSKSLNKKINRMP
jgi:serine/threonine protein kinase